MPDYEISDLPETGDYEITGDDTGEETGLAPPAPRGAARRGGAPGVVPQPSPRRRLTQVMPFNTLVLAAGATGTLIAQPQRPIRLQRMFLSSPTAGGLANFAVQNIVVGADQQFVNTGNAPAELWAFNAVGAGMKTSTANPGIVIAVQVQNISGAPATITGAVIGDSLE